MELGNVLENFSLTDLTAEADKINREHTFAAYIVAGTAIAVLLLAGFLLFTGSVPNTTGNLLTLIGIPILYAYIARLYFNAVKNETRPDWTLAVRLHNEKEKIAKQASLYRKLPTHFLLPTAVIIGVAILPAVFESRDDIESTKLGFYIISVVFIFSASIWGLKRAEKNKLRPLLEKLETLEAQLKEEHLKES